MVGVEWHQLSIDKYCFLLKKLSLFLHRTSTICWTFSLEKSQRKRYVILKSRYILFFAYLLRKIQIAFTAIITFRNPCLVVIYTKQEHFFGIYLQALDWGKQMVAMSGSGPGYVHTIIITPYMHLLMYHIPILLRKHGSLGFLVDKVIHMFILSLAP